MTEKQALAAVHRYQQQQARKRALFLVVRDDDYSCYVQMATADRTVAAQEIREEMTGGIAPHCPVWWWTREPGSARRPFIPPPRERDNDEPPITCPYRIQQVRDGQPIMIGHAE